MDDIDIPSTLLAIPRGPARQDALEASTELQDALISYVETSHTLYRAVEDWGLPWSRLYRWTISTPELRKRFSEAEQVRSRAIVDRIDNELQAIAFSDLRLCFGPDGRLLPVTEWPDRIAAAVAGIDVQELFAKVDGEQQLEGYLKKLKLWDKPGAAKMLGQMHGQFSVKIDQRTTVTLDQTLESVWAQREAAK